MYLLQRTTYPEILPEALQTLQKQYCDQIIFWNLVNNFANIHIIWLFIFKLYTYAQLMTEGKFEIHSTNWPHLDLFIIFEKFL